MEKPVTTEANKEMSFLDHLEELRWHLFRSLMAIVVISTIVFLFKGFVFKNIILAPKNSSFFTYQFLCGLSETLCFSPPKFTIAPRELGEQFFTHLKVSVWLGLIVAFPYIFWEFWRFIKPGLYETETKAARGIVLSCSLLFLSGVLFGYYIISPFAITFLAGYSVDSQVVSSPSLSSYVNYLTVFTIPTGCLFELPIVVYFLSRIGLLSPAVMKRYRKHAVIVILIIASIITPPDIITQVLVGIPVYFLYELSIGVSRRAYAKYHKK